MELQRAAIGIPLCQEEDPLPNLSATLTWGRDVYPADFLAMYGLAARKAPADRRRQEWLADMDDQLRSWATKMIGRGGTAIVYEARPHAGGHRAAVKVLRPQFLASNDAVERMRIETEILLCLRHPNIVRVHDFGRLPHGAPYLVEQRLYGHTLLREIQKRGPIPAPKRVQEGFSPSGGPAANPATVDHDSEFEDLRKFTQAIGRNAAHTIPTAHVPVTDGHAKAAFSVLAQLPPEAITMAREPAVVLREPARTVFLGGGGDKAMDVAAPSSA